MQHLSKITTKGYNRPKRCHISDYYINNVKWSDQNDNYYVAEAKIYTWMHRNENMQRLWSFSFFHSLCQVADQLHIYNNPTL